MAFSKSQTMQRLTRILHRWQSISELLIPTVWFFRQNDALECGLKCFTEFLQSAIQIREDVQDIVARFGSNAKTV